MDKLKNTTKENEKLTAHLHNLEKIAENKDDEIEIYRVRMAHKILKNLAESRDVIWNVVDSKLNKDRTCFYIKNHFSTDTIGFL